MQENEIKPGWSKQKTNSLLEPDVTQVVYRKTACSRFLVVADFRGVKFDGESDYFTNPSDMESFAWIVADAGREFLRLRRARIVINN